MANSLLTIRNVTSSQTILCKCFPTARYEKESQAAETSSHQLGNTNHVMTYKTCLSGFLSCSSLSVQFSRDVSVQICVRCTEFNISDKINSHHGSSSPETFLWQEISPSQGGTFTFENNKHSPWGGKTEPVQVNYQNEKWAKMTIDDCKGWALETEGVTIP